MSKLDKIFSESRPAIGDFNFGEQTAEVFDDMLDRSIPQYRELQRMLGELAGEFAQDGTRVYDLGCSTGITLESLRRGIREAGKVVSYVGIDYSQAMLERAAERFSQHDVSERPHLMHADLNNGCAIEDASLVVLNLTLQFVRPLHRDALIAQIASGLNDKACLILVEKVLGVDSFINRTFIKFYYDMKRRNGYSETEIVQKREALENVLIPYRVDENIDLLKANGFSDVEVFFRWYNFAGIVAVKRCSTH